MDSARLELILPLFKNLRHEEQYAFVFLENKLINHFLFSSTHSKNSGLTDFKKIKELLPYAQSKYDIIFVHNHPKSLPSPSHGDFDNMKLITYFCNICNILLHDYLIVSEYGFFSFKKNNLLPNQLTLCFLCNKKCDLRVISNIYNFNHSSIIEISKLTGNYSFSLFSKKKIFLFNFISFDNFLDIFNSKEDLFFLYKENSFPTNVLSFLIRPFDLKKIS